MSIVSGWFAKHARHAAIGSTLSAGQAECLKVLQTFDHRRIGLTGAQVARALSVRQPTEASVRTVLDAISATLVTKTGSGATAKYKLTRTGVKAARHQRPRPQFPWPSS